MNASAHAKALLRGIGGRENLDNIYSTNSPGKFFGAGRPVSEKSAFPRALFGDIQSSVGRRAYTDDVVAFGDCFIRRARIRAYTVCQKCVGVFRISCETWGYIFFSYYSFMIRYINNEKLMI